jgi:hypothetical protein
MLPRPVCVTGALLLPVPDVGTTYFHPIYTKPILYSSDVTNRLCHRANVLVRLASAIPTSQGLRP